MGAFAATIGGWVLYVNLSYARDFSSTPRPEIRASTDAKVIADGEYLVHAVAHCTACHGNPEQTTKHELPTDKKDLRGGYVIHAGPFGTYYAANLTADPGTGIGKLSDADLARVIRHGVSPSGRWDAIMGLVVGPMSDEDLIAVISYLRTLPAIDNRVPADEWGFMAKALSGRFNPRMEVARKYVPRGEVSKERGEYLANGPADCFFCHSPRDPMQGFALAGDAFSGANEADPDAFDPAFEVMAPNLTPDPETGVLANFADEQQFVDRVKKVGATNRGTQMPWDNFKQMTDEDLKSIFRYLKSLPPVKHATGPTRRAAGWKPPK